VVVVVGVQWRRKKNGKYGKHGRETRWGEGIIQLSEALVNVVVDDGSIIMASVISGNVQNGLGWY
jgi:hypothetical protein